jgi:hypothetical protein
MHFLRLDSLLQNSLQEVPMAVGLVVRAVTHQCDVSALGKSLEQPHRELLTMILYRSVLLINRAVRK